MKERPILFSGPMVRAILGGYKTQTRRIVKPQPPCGCRYVINGAGNAALCQSIDRPEIWVPPTARSVDHRLPCPYGQPGDRLWVRETWNTNGVLPIEHRAPGDWIYRAELNEQGVTKYSSQWKPSIHMPRAASRITLEVTAVRVERLQDISEEDAKAEGVANVDSFKGIGVDDKKANRYAYRELWQSINGPGSWDANPWVWVIEFRRVAQ